MKERKNEWCLFDRHPIEGNPPPLLGEWDHTLFKPVPMAEKYPHTYSHWKGYLNPLFTLPPDDEILYIYVTGLTPALIWVLDHLIREWSWFNVVLLHWDRDTGEYRYQTSPCISAFKSGFFFAKEEIKTH